MASLSALGWMQLGASFISSMGEREVGRMERIQGERAKEAADFAAWQEEQQAQRVIAASHREAEEIRRQQALIESRNLAVAAAGGGASDPTVIRMISGLAQRGAYQVATTLYEANVRARSMKLNAAAERITGSYQRAAGAGAEAGRILSATGRFASTGLSLYAKYGMGGPDTPDDLDQPVG